MFFDTDIAPSVPFAEIVFMGPKPDKVDPPFTSDNWDHVATVKAEKLHSMTEWWYSTEMTHEIDPAMAGFWMWGDVLVRVIPATILESGLYIFRRKEAADGA